MACVKKKVKKQQSVKILRCIPPLPILGETNRTLKGKTHHQKFKVTMSPLYTQFFVCKTTQPQDGKSWEEVL